MNYHDPLIHSMPTQGEMPAISPRHTESLAPISPQHTGGLSPLAPPLAHTTFRPPHDQLLTRGQQAIMKATNDIFTILSTRCDCEKCHRGVMVILSDLLSEALTDQTIMTLSFNKLEKQIKELKETIHHFMEAGGTK